jgi:TonB family protein
MVLRLGAFGWMIGLLPAWFASGCAGHNAAPATTIGVEAGAAVAPRVVRQGALEVPSELRERPCASGVAVVEVQVTAVGKVGATRVSQTSGEPAFDEACLRSAQAASYEPGSHFGEPVAGITRVECRLQCP